MLMEMDDEDEHYDTPWEYRNRAIFAALSKSTNIPAGIQHSSLPTSPSTSSTVSSPIWTDENQCHGDIKKEQSSKFGSYNNTKINSNTTSNKMHTRVLSHDTSNGSSDSQLLKVHHLRRFSHAMATPQVPDRNNNNNIKNSNFHSPKTPHSNRLSYEQSVCKDPGPLMTVSTTSISPPYGMGKTFDGNSTAWKNGNKQFVYTKPSSNQKFEESKSVFFSSQAQNRMPNSSTTILNTTLAKQQNHRAQETFQSAYPLVSPTLLQHTNFPNQDPPQTNNQCKELPNKSQKPRKSRKEFDESNLIHEGMERVKAEQILKAMDVGDFLLRRRNEGSLALSLKSQEGVLHIKLELRDGLWVLGEGPRFPTVSGMLRCYQKMELPVRAAAERVRLKTPITTSELAFLYVPAPVLPSA